jgi:hypothetical protein
LAAAKDQRFRRDLGLGQGKTAEFQDMHGGKPFVILDKGAPLAKVKRD